MKKVVIILGIVCAAFTSNAAYLLWQVTSDDASAVKNWSDNGYVSVSYSSENAGSGRLVTVSRADAAAGAISTDLSTFTAGETYSIFVELWNYSNNNWTKVGETKVNEYVDTSLQYTAFAQNCTYIDAGFSPTTPQVWHGGTITVPEPTSGMMMMVGLALLALKRRKA